ncbi:hypothetical protein M378DRAFT_455823 [Amanita muscaria Koide BX008]|uniref:Secreted protein n=1 Tax=Amanita muscaria (strain Koide BX008) TaxID=946122 RepID=A0A0C2SRK7_AMAMK|nr:hypothetical protein M378DRAFT_455823 [Amanita muscaria Koide BX008]
MLNSFLILLVYATPLCSRSKCAKTSKCLQPSPSCMCTGHEESSSSTPNQVEATGIGKLQSSRPAPPSPISIHYYCKFAEGRAERLPSRPSPMNSASAEARKQEQKERLERDLQQEEKGWKGQERQKRERGDVNGEGANTHRPLLLSLYQCSESRYRTRAKRLTPHSFLNALLRSSVHPFLLLITPTEF